MGRFDWLGGNLIAEYDGNPANTGILRRYVHGPGSDEPIVWYEGSGTTNRRFLMRDERGSIVSVSDSAGTTLAVNRYDEYGIPASTNMGRFQYTGQAWLPEIGLYYYRARIYSPTLGRFLQPDPIGYGDGMNMYAYVGGDPVNYVDPLGLEKAKAEVPSITDCGIKPAACAESTLGLGGGIFDKLGSIITVLGHRSPGLGLTPGPRIVASGVNFGGDLGLVSGSSSVDVYVDESCANIAALQNPRVRRRALTALRRSLNYGGPMGVAEHGFWVSSGFRGGFELWPIFSSGRQNSINPEQGRPWAVTAWLNGAYAPDLFIHTHPSGYDTSVSGADAAIANEQSVIVAAINARGRISCAQRRQ